jgi:hypothetical protein
MTGRPGGTEIKWATLAVCADDVNLLGGNIDTIEKNTQNLIDTSKEVGLKVNTEKPNYIAVSTSECRTKSLHKER